MTVNLRRRAVWWLCAAAAVLALIAIPLASASAGMQPLSSGIGKDDRSPHPNYPLKLVFATSQGHYLAAIDVTLLDDTGKEVLKTHSIGPWLFLDVQPGTYKVLAKRVNGETASGTVTVGTDGQRVLTLTWKPAK